jgi:hypothetical protein
MTIETTTLKAALLAMLGAAEGLSWHLRGNKAGQFLPAVKSAVSTFGQASEQFSTGYIVPAFYDLRDGWNQMAEVMHELEWEAGQGGITYPRLEIMTRPKVRALGFAVNTLGGEVDAVVNRLIRGRERMSPREVNFVSQVVPTVVFTPYEFRAPTEWEIDSPDDACHPGTQSGQQPAPPDGGDSDWTDPESFDTE